MANFKDDTYLCARYHANKEDLLCEVYEYDLQEVLEYEMQQLHL